MSNSFFQFKQFTVHQDKCAMKVTTDSCLFGAWVANDLQKNNSANSLFDVGGGTGLLSLMVAQKNPQLNIDAIEIDTEAAAQALQNVSESAWKKRIKVINGDVKEFNPGNKYDVIISNPPFYENELQSDNRRKNIAHHSEDLSLDDLLNVIQENLNATGNFYLLLPYKRNKEIEPLLRKYGFSASYKVSVRQSIDHNYFRILLKAGLQNIPVSEEEISIRDNNQQYTTQFIDLVKDYYLYL